MQVVILQARRDRARELGVIPSTSVPLIFTPSKTTGDSDNQTPLRQVLHNLDTGDYQHPSPPPTPPPPRTGAAGQHTPPPPPPLGPTLLHRPTPPPPPPPPPAPGIGERGRRQC